MDYGNDAWIKFQDDVNSGRIPAREAVEYVLSRDSGVHGGQLAALLAEIREREAKEEARDKNQQIIIGYLERQEAATEQQRADFRALFEIVNGHTLDINDLKQTVAEHDREIASFRQSRDASIEERRRLSADLDASKEDRARIHEELRQAAEERKTITEALARIEALQRNGNGH
jgi:chromosome segregation ATPase